MLFFSLRIYLLMTPEDLKELADCIHLIDEAIRDFEKPSVADGLRKLGIARSRLVDLDQGFVNRKRRGRTAP